MKKPSDESAVLRWEFRVLQKNSEPGLKWLSETNSALFIGEGGLFNNFFIAVLVQPNIVSLDLSVYKRKVQFMKKPSPDQIHHNLCWPTQDKII